jgi:hypothetical protein
MPLIDTTTLLGIADRAAYQSKTIIEAMEELAQEGGGFYFDRVTATDDADVEIPTATDYHNVDVMQQDADRVLKYALGGCTIIDDMNAHFARRDGSGAPLQVGGWDGYLYSNDERVSWWFNRLYFACRSSYMLSINVFSETDDLFGTVEMQAGPTLNYTDGVNYGNGADFNPADGNNFAATQLKAKVVTMGASELDLRLSVKDKYNNPTTIDISIPASSPVGTEIPIGGTSDRFLDVMSVSLIPFSDYGTIGDTIEIRNLKEREISL